MNRDGLKADKAAARKAAMARRDRLKGRIDEARATAHLIEHLGSGAPRPLAGFLPIGSEIDPRPAMAHLAETREIGVPVVLGRGRPLAFRAWSPDCALIDGPFGVPVPAAGAAVTPLDLIVPLLAFDRSGVRLGYGGGFYDRTLEALRRDTAIRAIGLAFAGQEVGDLPADATDQKLDAIVTDAGIFIPVG